MFFASSGKVSALSDPFHGRRLNPGKNFATQRWNLILGVFYEQMPLKRHWKLLWPYDNSFTGREAVEFLLRVLPKLVINTQIYRSNCFLLLQKFMKERLIFNPRNPKDTKFHDDSTIYRFDSERILEELRKTADSSFMDSSFPYYCPPRQYASCDDIASDGENLGLSRTSSFRSPSFRRPRNLFSSFRQRKGPPVFSPPPPPRSNPPPTGGQRTPLVLVHQENCFSHSQLHRKRFFEGSSSSIPCKLPRTSS